MIQIENTPNPNALKFQSEKQLSEVDTQEFQKKKGKSFGVGYRQIKLKL